MRVDAQFAHMIRDVMQNKHLHTVSELANASSIQESTWSRILSGKQAYIKPETTRKLCAFLHIDLAALAYVLEHGRMPAAPAVHESRAAYHADLPVIAWLRGHLHQHPQDVPKVEMAATMLGYDKGKAHDSNEPAEG